MFVFSEGMKRVAEITGKNVPSYSIDLLDTEGLRGIFQKVIYACILTLLVSFPSIWWSVVLRVGFIPHANKVLGVYRNHAACPSVHMYVKLNSWTPILKKVYSLQLKHVLEITISMEISSSDGLEESLCDLTNSSS